MAAAFRETSCRSPVVRKARFTLAEASSKRQPSSQGAGSGGVKRTEYVCKIVRKI